MKSTHLQAGAAKIDITPQVGCDLTGFIAREGPSLALHDPLFARALAVRDDNTQALLISCDLLGLEAAFVAHARQAIEHEIGVPAQHIMIAATHTHAGPASMFLRYTGDVDASYMAQLVQRLVEAARAAWSTLRPVSLFAGKTRVAGVSVNRREADGPVDEDLDLVRFDDEHGKPLAAIVSFACHPLTGGGDNRSISADFCGVLTDGLEEATGATTLFLNGACAQINSFYESFGGDVSSGTFSTVQTLGEALAQAALDIWPQTKSCGQSTLHVQTRHLTLPLLPVDEESLPLFIHEQTQAITQAETCSDYKAAAAMLDWAWETRDALTTGRVLESVNVEVQAVQIGDVVFAAVPGELFVELGFQIKQGSAPQHVVVAGYANGNFGYIPTRAAYPQGGYEVDLAYRYYGYPAPFAPAAGEMLVDALKEMIRPMTKAKETV